MTKTKEICLQGLFLALVTLGTMVLQVPVAATQGYIHLGDSMILLVAIFFGARSGFWAGGLGSALADVLLGYGHWAPFTFLIKGLMGYVIGKIGHKSLLEGNKFFGTKTMLATLVGEAIMVVGYWLAGGFLEGSVLVSATSIFSNLVQAIGGAAIFYVVGYALFRGRIHNLITLQ